MIKEKSFYGENDFNGFKNFINCNQTKNNIEFSEYCSVFTFATENLDSYLKELDVENKDVLTVTSSGDQLINLALLNANNIDCFDINRLCYYYTKLKLTGLMFLDYEEFINFFVYCEDSIMMYDTLFALDINYQCFNYNIYNKLREKLDSDVRMFFDAVYSEYNCDGISVARSPLFNNISLVSAMHNNTYLSSHENYYAAREKFEKLLVNKKIKFYNLDIFKLHELDEKYDIVLLSNIYDYIPLSSQSEFAEYIKYQLNKILMPNAKVAVEYQYCGSSRENSNNTIKNLSVNIKCIADSKYTLSRDVEALGTLDLGLIKVPTIYKELRKENIEDCVYVYKNTKHRRHI